MCCHINYILFDSYHKHKKFEIVVIDFEQEPDSNIISSLVWNTLGLLGAEKS